jgi:hypothetical protein
LKGHVNGALNNGAMPDEIVSFPQFEPRLEKGP